MRPPRGLYPDQAVGRRRDARQTATVRTVSYGRQAGGNCHRSTTGRSASGAALVPTQRAGGATSGSGFGVAGQTELQGVGLAGGQTGSARGLHDVVVGVEEVEGRPNPSGRSLRP